MLSCHSDIARLMFGFHPWGTHHSRSALKCNPLFLTLNVYWLHKYHQVYQSKIPRSTHTVYLCVVWTSQGGMWWRSGLRHCVKTGKLRFRIPIGSLEFFIDLILPTAVWSWGRSTPNRNEQQEYFLGEGGRGKGSRLVGLTKFVQRF